VKINFDKMTAALYAYEADREIRKTCRAARREAILRLPNAMRNKFKAEIRATRSAALAAESNNQNSAPVAGDRKQAMRSLSKEDRRRVRAKIRNAIVTIAQRERITSVLSIDRLLQVQLQGVAQVASKADSLALIQITRDQAHAILTAG
jgi:hypothetical protein